jgi:hypothetical protein
MAEDRGIEASLRSVPLLATMLTETAARPEHRELDRLVGTWDVRTRWQVVGGQPWQHLRGSVENRWILAGRVLESRSSDGDGTEAARVYYAFDPSAGDYVAISLTILSTFFVLERGTFDPLGPSIVFEGSEELPGIATPIRFHRTVTFVSDDEHTVGITYPDHLDGTFGGMFIEHQRTGA